MKFKLLAVATLATVVTYATDASAAIVHVEYTGLVSSAQPGADASLVSLFGMPYTAIYVFDTLNSPSGDVLGNGVTGEQNFVEGGTSFGPSITSPALSATLTVGATIFTIPNTHNGSFGSIRGANIPEGPFSEQYHDARDPTGDIFLANTIFNQDNVTSIPASIALPFTYSKQPGDVDFGHFCNHQGSCVLLNPITITETIENTPLPAALPLFATGLGALALLGWRRRKLAQQAGSAKPAGVRD